MGLTLAPGEDTIRVCPGPVTAPGLSGYAE